METIKFGFIGAGKVGFSLGKYLKENNIKEDILYNIFKEVQEIGPKIASLKGNTCYGIAMTIYEIMEAILLDKKEILPVSANLNGKYNKENPTQLASVSKIKT